MLPQFGYIVAQAGADSPYNARPYMPNIYYEDQYYRPPLPPLSRPTEWQHYPPWQPPQPLQVQKPVQEITTHWQDEAVELSEGEMVCQTQEFNDLMAQMDNEFWELCDDIYKERVESLKEELNTIQQGTHSAFKEIIADVEIKKEQTIEYAEYFKEYELSLAYHQYDAEINTIEAEYNTEKQHFHDMVLQTIEERRKQIKEDKDSPLTEDLFTLAQKKVTQSKKNLRKRAYPYEQQSSPLRHERRRQNRSKALYDINSGPSSLETENLDSDFSLMKGKTLNRFKYKY